MTDNAAKAIILSVLFGGIALTVMVGIWAAAWRARGKAKRSQGLSVEEWAARLHNLARALKDAEGADEQVAGRVLLDHAHLLRPDTKQCGCKAVPRVEEAGHF